MNFFDPDNKNKVKAQENHKKKTKTTPFHTQNLHTLRPTCNGQYDCNVSEPLQPNKKLGALRSDCNDHYSLAINDHYTHNAPRLHYPYFY